MSETTLHPHQCQPGEIFVFGSNEAGYHGKGAAQTAMQRYGAVWGVGFGHQGESFAIPTKDRDIRSLRLWAINNHVHWFIDYAKTNPEFRFFVTAIGTGLAGYNHEQIAPMFADAPGNCRLPPEWVAIIENSKGKL